MYKTTGDRYKINIYLYIIYSADDINQCKFDIITGVYSGEIYAIYSIYDGRKILMDSIDRKTNNKINQKEKEKLEKKFNVNIDFILPLQKDKD